MNHLSNCKKDKENRKSTIKRYIKVQSPRFDIYIWRRLAIEFDVMYLDKIKI